MRRFNVILLVAFLFVAGSSPLYPKGKKAAKTMDKVLATMIERGNFAIDINRMNPMGGQSRVVTYSYGITLRNDSVFTHLPYIGELYSVTYSSENGMNFDAPVNRYRVVRKKNGAAKVSFDAETREGTFQFMIDISVNGAALVYVSAMRRSSISYNGEVIQPAESSSR